MEEVWEKDGEEQPQSKVRMRIERENIDVLDTYIFIHMWSDGIMLVAGITTSVHMMAALWKRELKEIEKIQVL
jgi:hypothetical protein